MFSSLIRFLIIRDKPVKQGKSEGPTPARPMAPELRQAAPEPRQAAPEKKLAVLLASSLPEEVDPDVSTPSKEEWIQTAHVGLERTLDSDGVHWIRTHRRTSRRRRRKTWQMS